ncbi:hypothetical protein CPC735_061790 [Coccidioides posadasii C735 delta SOWgp]|uniref:Cyclase family protein n=1 Tax=Coccidioides posadasii (strain C735) TaxID=222929 RepID=C5P3N8_COCP7|nr:hypothetical protein CPC735_061790 [Coccidioides posadasii C735 delta SOWgp]EER28306.1 hypothetical protein CPC735_061790 [Coccidioides posadasii C735 delta SOWgp]|eukprot:XP_003070451.1 hypothetical protein CPC735_061790 [Coccidioides posadasii C735 delta SOWgp]
MSGRPANLPKFSDLPLNKDDPPYSAWGLYGKDDQLGFLNRQTNETVKEAAKEIQSGVRVSMNWPLDAQGDIPLFGRQVFQKQIVQRSPRIVYDDIWTFNTQSSSQWDGLRHVAYQKEKRFYNGVTMDDIAGPNKNNANGVQAWAEKGIVGRGILLDYHKWRLANNIDIDIFKTSPIPLKHLKAVAESQGTEIKFGDILFIRTGYMLEFNKLSTAELSELAKQKMHSLIGVEQTEDMLEWIWENFSAVAGDHPAFEAYPPPEHLKLHEVLLAGWGCPIGELFDLDKLAEECEKHKRWSFFVTSEVCNVPGGVAR